MAFFKIFKGQSSNLPKNYNEGYCYLTTDDNKLYIDLSNNEQGRVCLNAKKADEAESVAWANIINKPSSYTPSSHTHDRLKNGNDSFYIYHSVDATDKRLLIRGCTGTSAEDYTYTYCSIGNNTFYDAYGNEVLTKAGGTLTGPLNFPNTTLNLIGDDAYIGDVDVAGCIGIKGANGNTGIYFAPYNGSVAQVLYTNGNGTATLTGSLDIGTHLSVGGYNDTSWAISTSTFICNDWVRTTGMTGWFNATYEGGIYMQDTTWVRTYNNKKFFVSNTDPDAIATAGGIHLYEGKALQRGGYPSAWVTGRDYALVKLNTLSGYSPIISQKTTNGSWEIGAFDETFTYLDELIFTYIEDIKYNNIVDHASGQICFKSNGTVRAWKVQGAVWNDYAEYRNTVEHSAPGYCVVENGDDSLRLSSKKLEKGAMIVSDTFGFAIGETEKCKTPIAVAGRVLAYTNEPREEYRKHIGDYVCAGPNGKICIMTNEEARDYSQAILGTVSAVPDYETWGANNVKIDGRVWIKVR